ncbi:MAG: SDR family NAD(P)-dependent oxidoreductase, partial [Pseudomonadota bacterium]
MSKSCDFGGAQTFALTPAGLLDPALAIAASRAGAVGVLNCEGSWSPADARPAVEKLASLARGPYGLFLPKPSKRWCKLVASLPTKPFCVIFDAPSFKKKRALAFQDLGCRVLAQVTSRSEAKGVEDDVDALWVKGHEAGGRVGEETSFILTNAFGSSSTKPFFIRGGIDESSAAAVQLGGASGVVLDDQLLLLDESPLKTALARPLSRFSGVETLLAESGDGTTSLRFWSPPGSSAARLLAEEIKVDGGFTSAHRGRLGWQLDAPGLGLPPMGQDAAIAPTFAERYGRISRVLNGFAKAKSTLPAKARALNVFGKGAPLAEAHGTDYPIVQGPMTHVSDRADFAKAVGDGGALPMLAVSLMRGEAVLDLLRDTKTAMDGRPWGVGMLGFLPTETLADQRAAILETKPQFAIIAGGRPDQAKEMEASGIRSYLHVPSPLLLEQFLAAGANSFIFEGRECGGHIGPVGSFVLWASMVRVLLRARMDRAAASNIHLLFAGGIHDARSTAMVSVIAAPLVEAGFKVGILMGTPYLYTKEAVDKGAIAPAFQDIAVETEGTATCATGPGHASRCAQTPFVDQFRDRRQDLQRRGHPNSEVSEELEAMSLGRLRLASKGVSRPASGERRYEDRSEAEQRDGGMYMIGQSASLLRERTSIEALHKDIAEGAQACLDAAVSETRAPAQPAAQQPCDIAIVGVSAILPGAKDAEGFWDNILAKVDSIREIPKDRWDIDAYFDDDRDARDKVYSRWGGFIDDVRFDPTAFGMPPTSLHAIDPLQLLGLAAVKSVLDDADLGLEQVDRDKVSVILGFSGGLGELGVKYASRAELFRSGGATAEALDALPEWSSDSFAGLLPNVAAGRAANRFDFGGINCTVDAACASSLAAIYQAVTELETGRSDLVVSGGIDTVQGPFGFTCFSKAQALSPNGRSRTFDAHADGIAISEGVAMIALKRLADAERDGDRVLAVLKGIGASSDGKAKGLMAPRPVGQMRALRRAYAQAGYSPSTVGLFEAHGTGTAAGDEAELETLTTILAEAGAKPKSAAVGSVKTSIGHTKSSAGVAGLVKTVYALHDKIMPPHRGVDVPNSTLSDEASPLYLSQEVRPWLKPAEHPRRAGVSAFGFGGTNFHVTLEEYDSHVLPAQMKPVSRSWPVELLVWQGETRDDLVEAMGATLQALNEGGDADLSSLGASLAAAKGEGAWRCAVVACTLPVLRDKLAATIEHMANDAGDKPKGVYIGEAAHAPKVAFLFSGQGSQYPDMFREAAARLGDMRDVFDDAHQILHSTPKFCDGKRLGQLVYPPERFSPEEDKAARTALTATSMAQPALGAVGAGLAAFLKRLGIEPAMACGHSYGEFVALHAAGALDLRDLLSLSEARGRLVEGASSDGDLGTMLAVLAPEADIQQAVEGIEGVHFANFNAPRQTILSGAQEAIDRAKQACEREGITAKSIPVAAAFHSPLMAPAALPLSKEINEITWHELSYPVYHNANGLPHETGQVAERMHGHLLGPVLFIQTINAMYEEGARLFLEVGPKSVLTELTKAVLVGRPHRAIALDGRGGDLPGMIHALGELFVDGVDFDVASLFKGRGQAFDVGTLSSLRRETPLAPQEWLINGTRAYRPGEAPLPTPAPSPVKQVTATRDATPASLDPPSVAPTTQTLPPGFVPLAQATGLSNRRQSLPIPSAEGIKTMNANGAPPGPGLGERTLTEYFGVMRQFLQSQESVMLGLLGQGVAPSPYQSAGQDLFGQAPTAPEPVTAQPVLAPQPVAAAPSVEQPLTNGHAPANGHVNGELNGHAPMPEPVPAPAPAPAVPEASAPSVAAAPAPAPSALNIGDELVKLISERTGYPEDMLSPTADIEGDLGIDSIKRTEILGALRGSLPDTAAAMLEDRMEELSKAKSLSDIETIVTNALGSDVESQRPFDLSGEASTACAALPRFIIKAHHEPADHVALETPAGGAYVLLAADEGELAEKISKRIEEAGGIALIVPPNRWRDGAEFGRWLSDLKTKYPVSALIALGNTTKRRFSTDMALEAFRASVSDELKVLFPVLRAASDDLAQGGTVMVASAMGGFFARGADDSSHQAPFPAAAGAVGLLKSLTFEWPEAKLKAVDLDPDDDVDDHAACLFRELFLPGGRREVGYPKGQRTIFRTVPASIQKSDARQADSDWVVLAVGGLKGITAETLRGLAARKATLVLVGRTGAPEQEDPALAGCTERTSLMRHFIDQAKAAGIPPQPAEIERQISRVLSEREMRGNLADFAAMGARVDIRTTDVRSEDAVRDLLAGVYTDYGRVDAVLYGAGTIEDALLAKKDDDASIARVIDTKCDGAFLFAKYLRPETLQFFGFYTSVAGRYGNKGQTDYGAANEVLNQLAYLLHKEWGGQVKVCGINWGPWLRVTHGSGMVTPETKAQFEARGVSLIHPDEGRDFVLNEVLHGHTDDIEVIAGDNPW